MSSANKAKYKGLYSLAIKGHDPSIKQLVEAYKKRNPHKTFHIDKNPSSNNWKKDLETIYTFLIK